MSAVPGARGKAAVVTFATVVAAIAFAGLQFGLLSDHFANFFAASLFAAFTVIAGFWFGTLRLAQAKAPRVYIEVCALTIVLLVIPYHLLLVALLTKNQYLPLFTQHSLQSYFIYIGILVAIGSLIGIALAVVFAAWGALQRPPPDMGAATPVYGSLIACVLIEFLMLFAIPNGQVGTWQPFGVYAVTLLACIIFPIIGYVMALHPIA